MRNILEITQAKSLNANDGNQNSLNQQSPKMMANSDQSSHISGAPANKELVVSKTEIEPLLQPLQRPSREFTPCFTKPKESKTKSPPQKRQQKFDNRLNKSGEANPAKSKTH